MKSIFTYNSIRSGSSFSIYRNNISGAMMIFMLLIFLLQTSCKKFITNELPRNEISSSFVFTDDASATAALAGIYSQMANHDHSFANGSSTGISARGGLLADELISYERDLQLGSRAYYTNSLLPVTASVESSFWVFPYETIYATNAILEGLEVSSLVSTSVKNQLKGEAKFIRAFTYFHLVNLFGDVPLILTTDYRVNTLAPRANKQTVYQQILMDLQEAQTLLQEDYPSGTERIRANKSVAAALLARVQLYLGNWLEAEAQSTILINNTARYSLLDNLNGIFLKNSKEAILQFQRTPISYPTEEGYLYILVTAPTLVSMTNQLYNAFETGDTRKANWVGMLTVGSATFYYPFKYKVRLGTVATEYSTVMRLAEQFLIRAEARTMQNKIADAQADLNAIRNRAGLPNTTAANQSDLKVAIEQERRVELFTEFGHRWLDLKRWNRTDAVLGPVKAPNWQSTDVLFPIPRIQLIADPNVTQNPGY